MGSSGLRRANDPPLLILVSLADGPKHGHALAISKVMPYAVTGVLALWMVVTGRRARRQGERFAAQAAAAQAAAAEPAPEAATPALAAS